MIDTNIILGYYAIALILCVISILMSDEVKVKDLLLSVLVLLVPILGALTFIYLIFVILSEKGVISRIREKINAFLNYRIK